jgi:hypothetical protein
MPSPPIAGQPKQRATARRELTFSRTSPWFHKTSHHEVVVRRGLRSVSMEQRSNTVVPLTMSTEDNNAERGTHAKCGTHEQCDNTGIPFAQVGRLCGSPSARTDGGKPRPYGGYGDSHSVHGSGWSASERVRRATCEVLCRGGVYPLPARPPGTHHLSEGDTRDATMPNVAPMRRSDRATVRSTTGI